MSERRSDLRSGGPRFEQIACRPEPWCRDVEATHLERDMGVTANVHDDALGISAGEVPGSRSVATRSVRPIVDAVGRELRHRTPVVPQWIETGEPCGEVLVGRR